MTHRFTTLVFLAIVSVSNVFSQTIILTQDFESGNPPAGWTRSQNTPSVGWSFGLSLGSIYVSIPPHTRYACSNDDAHDDNSHLVNVADKDRLISPFMDLTPYSSTGVAVYFDYLLPGNFGSTGHIEASTDGGTTWVNVANIPSSFSWKTGFADLSVYTSYANVQFCFRHNDHGYWADGFALDNVIFQTIPPVEAVLNSVSLPKYGLTNTNYPLQFNVSNQGTDTITSLTLNWSDGTSHLATLPGLSIPPGGSASLNHPIPVNYSTVVEKNIVLHITLVNGIVDAFPLNNIDSVIFHTVSSAVAHNVVAETGTSTANGWSPRAKVVMDYMNTNHPGQFINIAIHSGDSMMVASYDSAGSFSSLPNCNVERVLLDQPVTQTDFINYYNTRKPLVVPASINVSNTWNSVTRDISASITAQFLTNISVADMRLAIIVVENGVTGSGDGTMVITNDYDQVNFYAGGGQGVMGGFESLPSPVSAALMQYDYVGRALLGGYAGQTGSVPGSVTDLQNVNYIFNYTLPVNYQEGNVKLVGLLIDQTDGSIVNAVEVPMNINIGIEENTEELSLRVYPNPATVSATAEINMLHPGDVELALYDLSGKQVYNYHYANLSGTQYLPVPVDGLAKGTYLVSISIPGKTYAKQLIVQ